jgi:Terminase large subunit, T4likevirus-type, N-terminal
VAQQQAEVSLQLHPRQSDALTSRATEILYGGAAGGGKSHLMRAAAITWCASIPGLCCYIFRRISDDLIKNHLEGPAGFRVMLAPWVDAKLVEIVEGEIRFWNGARIFLCHCKDAKDVYRYQGAEIHVLLIDELTHFQDDMYRFLRSRVRMVGLSLPPQYVGAFPRVLAGSNPGNVGHHWVKAAFIDGVAPMDLRQMGDDEGGMVRQYIPARLDDNPSMAANDPTYRQRLRGLGSPALVKAMEDGDWNVVAGAFFPEWSTVRHVVPDFWPPAEWLVFASFDWGSARPFSVGWWAVANGDALPDGRLYPRGALIRWAEWYGMRPGSPNVGLQLHAEVVADGIRHREAEFARHGVKVTYRVADPSIFREDGGPSIAERMRLPWRPADNSRMAGWDQVRARLAGDEGGSPYLMVTERCRDTIRTLPALQSDSVKLDDVDSDGEDHAGDEVRYACMSRPWVRPVVVVPPVKVLNQMTYSELLREHDKIKPRRRRI